MENAYNGIVWQHNILSTVKQTVNARIHTAAANTISNVPSINTHTNVSYIASAILIM